MLVKLWEHMPQTFAIFTDFAHCRRLARVAAADECVIALCLEREWQTVGFDGPFLEVTLDYEPGEGGAEEIANAWLAASALLPDVTL